MSSRSLGPVDSQENHLVRMLALLWVVRSIAELDLGSIPPVMCGDHPYPVYPELSVCVKVNSDGAD